MFANTPTPALNTQMGGKHPHPAWRLSWLIVLIVTLKSVYLAFFVIPPADIPDESGHYAYVKDIANGTLFPLLGTATIPNDLWMDLPDKEVVSTRINYIVQHPPLYYAIAAIPYTLTSKVTDDRWYLIRITRLVSAISLGMTVLVVFRTLINVGLDPGRSLLASTSIAFIPTLNSLSAGITNDAFLLLVCAVATHYLVRFVLNNRLRDAYLCALWLTLAGATKMTAWIIIAGFVAVMIYELRQPLLGWIRHAIGITALSLLAPLWWMARNLSHFGDPFYIGISADFAPVMPGATMWQFLESQPFFYFMLVHFYALFGFSGYCQTPSLVHLCEGSRITHVNNEPFFYFLLVLVLVVILTMIFAAKQAWKLTAPARLKERPGSVQGWMHSVLARKSIRLALLVISLSFGIGLYVYAMQTLHVRPGIFNGHLVNGIALAPLLIIPFSLVAVLIESNQAKRLPHHLMLVFALFGFIFIMQAHKAYMLVGEMRGAQGRYFFPYIPMLLAVVATVFSELRVPVKVALWIALGLSLAEIYTYVQHVLPFFESVKI